MRRARLDAELVRRGLARSREQAAELISAGRVSVGGRVATKAATAIGPGEPVLVKEDVADEHWASRGAHKLIGALDAFTEITVDGRRCLDAGASTGGFTDVLLRRGASRVVAVDVGYGQLDWRLRTDPRVDTHDRTNVRTLTPEIIGGKVDLIVADLSFISLGLVLPRVDRLRRRRGGHRSDGEAAVRGGSGPARCRRGGARPRAAGRGGAGCRHRCWSTWLGSGGCDRLAAPRTQRQRGVLRAPAS